MDQSTQVSIKNGFTSLSQTGSPRHSETEAKPSPWSNLHSPSKSKTHLGFQLHLQRQNISKQQVTYPLADQPGHSKHQPATATEYANNRYFYSPRHQQPPARKDLNNYNYVKDVGFSASSRKVRRDDLLLVNSGGLPDPHFISTKASRKNAGIRRAAAIETRTMRGDRNANSNCLFIRSKTMPLGDPYRKSARSSGQPSCATPTHCRQGEAHPADHVRHWLKHPRSASVEKSKPEADDVGENGKPSPSVGSDGATMGYMYYLPLQLEVPDDEDKRDMTAIPTVSLPKKGRLKLTGLPFELNNPEVHDDKREESNHKKQQRLYNDAMMGPALPTTMPDLYRGTLFRNKSIVKQVKQGEQMMEQEEEAVRQRRYWQEQDPDVGDLIEQLLHYDMPEVPTINKNLQTFTGCFYKITNQGLECGDDHKTKHYDNLETKGKSITTNNSNNNISSKVTNTTTNNNNSSIKNNFPYDINVRDTHNQQTTNRPITKSKSAHERTRELDTSIQLPNSPRSLNLGGPQTSTLSISEMPNSARSLTPREMTTTFGGKTLHSDWLTPWGNCDSLHSILTHAQKVTFARTNANTRQK